MDVVFSGLLVQLRDLLQKRKTSKGRTRREATMLEITEDKEFFTAT